MTKDDIHKLRQDLYDHFHYQILDKRRFDSYWIRRKPFRTTKEFAKHLLIQDENISLNGQIQWLEIKNIGLGVCEIDVAPLNIKTTKMVKEFSWKRPEDISA